ncbi:MAG: hypothetical protein ACRC1K_15645 [Planctomycetia bacterium]
MEELHIGGSGSTDKLATALSNCTKLEELSISNSRFEEVRVSFFKSIPNLRVLSLGPTTVDLEDVRQLGVKHLFLSGCIIRSSLAENELRDLRRSELKSFFISRCSVHCNVFSLLHLSRSVEEVWVVDSEFVQPDWFNVRDLPLLRRLGWVGNRGCPLVVVGDFHAALRHLTVDEQTLNAMFVDSAIAVPFLDQLDIVRTNKASESLLNRSSQNWAKKFTFSPD